MGCRSEEVCTGMAVHCDTAACCSWISCLKTDLVVGLGYYSLQTVELMVQDPLKKRVCDVSQLLWGREDKGLER